MSRLLVVAGKGGVGKTTVTAVMARASADSGLRVLVVTLDSRTGLSELLGGRATDGTTYDGTTIHTGLGPNGTGSIHLRTVTASEALQDYLATQGLARLAKRLVATGVVGVVSSAAPGIDDLLVLGKIKHLVGLTGPDGEHDLIVVDAPAAGHALSFLQSPRAMATTIRGGPLRSQAIEVQQMLTDPDKCRVLMVTLPETTPVNEMLETTELLRESVGVAFAPVVVNNVDIATDVEQLVAAGGLPAGALGEAAAYRAERSALHRQAIDRITAHGLDDVITLPHVATASMSADDVTMLADQLRGVTPKKPRARKSS
jgi:anion-transporting  ArsA/GET3 family ATPase